MLEVKVTAIGNSLGVLLPKDARLGRGILYIWSRIKKVLP